MQARKSVLAITALLILGISSAWSAEVTGRISYIYPDGHRIILSGRDEYTLAPNIDASKLGVGEFVRLTVDGRQVTQVSPGPPSLAGSAI